MWTEGLVKILGDRDNTEGKYVVAATDIPAGLLVRQKELYCNLACYYQIKSSCRNYQLSKDRSKVLI